MGKFCLEVAFTCDGLSWFCLYPDNNSWIKSKKTHVNTQLVKDASFDEDGSAVWENV